MLLVALISTALQVAEPVVAQTPLAPAKARQADSLRRLLAQPAGPDSARLNRLLRLARLVQSSDSGQAGRLARQALQLAEQLRAPLGRARALLQLGQVRSLAGANSEAATILEAARRLARQAKAPTLESRILNRHSAALTAMGRGPEAAQLALLAVSRGEAGADSAVVAEAYHALGRADLQQRNYPAAQRAFEQSLRVYEQTNNVKGQATALNMLGITSRDALQRPQAEAFFMRSLALSRSVGDSAGVAGVAVSLGVLEMRLFTRPSAFRALVFLRRAERIYKTLGVQNPAVLADLYSIMAANLSNSRQWDEGLKYAQLSLRMARQSHDLKEVTDALEGLGMLSFANEEYEKAYEYEHQSKLVSDTIQSVAAAAKMAEMQTKFETEKKEAHNRLQAAQLVAQRQVIERREVQLVAGLVIALLLLGLGWLLYNRRRLRREVEFALERQQLERLRATAVLDAEEAERRRVGADLHDGVGQMLSVVKLNVDALNEELARLLDPDQSRRFTDALELVDESVREVRSISHNLLPNALIKRGLGLAVREFLDTMQRSASRLRIRLETLGLDEARLDPAVENALYRVIQELVQNIVKHAQATEMNLQLIRHAHELTLLVEDNGIGFITNNLTPDAGIGLRNIESRVAYLGGTLEVDSRPGRGTTVTATVPLPTKPAA
jgi:signal transduction histidine kinase